jgi:putative endonuclease
MSCYVYILTNKSNTLYIGSANDLQTRIKKHKSSKAPHFTAKHKIDKLIYYKEYSDRNEARFWENRIKG